MRRAPSVEAMFDGERLVGGARGSDRKRCRANAFARGDRTGVLMTLMRSLRRTSSKLDVNFVSLSRPAASGSAGLSAPTADRSGRGGAAVVLRAGRARAHPVTADPVLAADQVNLNCHCLSHLPRVSGTIHPARNGRADLRRQP